AICLSCLRRYPRQHLELRWAKDGILFNRITCHTLFCESKCRCSVTKCHVGKSQICHDPIIFRLFVKETFQFTTSLDPALPRASIIAGYVLRPTQPKSQFAIEEAN